MLFNWFGDPILYVAGAARNAVLVFHLAAGGDSFDWAGSFAPRELDYPVDLAPANREVADPVYSSNTSIAAGSDFYVANRGNGSLLRMRQDGCVLAVRNVMLPGGRMLGTGRLNGIAVSPDARRLWLTVTGTLPGYPAAGALLEVPAFSPRLPIGEARNHHPRSGETPLPQTVAHGSLLFNTSFTPETGLGPAFNARSCAECHQHPKPGGMGPGGLAIVKRIGRIEGGSFNTLRGSGGPVSRARSLAEFGIPCHVQTGPSELANVISLRNAPPLFGLGAIEGIPESVIKDQAARRGTVAGRVNMVSGAEGTLNAGRFGWKASAANLEQFVAEAFRDELGMGSSLAPESLLPQAADCAREAQWTTGIGQDAIHAVTAFIASLPPPSPASAQQDPIGRVLFSAMGCTACHTPAMPGAAGEVPLYSDLLLHGMGPGLDDGIVQGNARGGDWRTTPLWGLGMRHHLLHDGRAANVRDAIVAHDGEGRASAMSFLRLTTAEQDALLTFLLGL
jgi:mono/diheme cytochrome c family protein